MSIVTPVGPEDARRWLTRRMVIGPAVVLSIATGAAIAGLIVFAQHTSTVLRVYFAALGLFIGLQAIRNFAAYAFGGEVATASRRRPERGRVPNWPSELFDMEARVSLAKVSVFDYDSRLRPLLRELAAERLASRWNIDLAKQPSAARAHVSDVLWTELGDPLADDRDPRFVPGPSLAKIHELIKDLQAI